MQPSATAHASGLAISSPTVTSNAAHGALSVTLQRNFSQIMSVHVGERLDVEAGRAPGLLEPLDPFA